MCVYTRSLFVCVRIYMYVCVCLYVRARDCGGPPMRVCIYVCIIVTHRSTRQRKRRGGDDGASVTRGVRRPHNIINVGTCVRTFSSVLNESDESNF